jgi:hypothetical protein
MNRTFSREKKISAIADSSHYKYFTSSVSKKSSNDFSSHSSPRNPVKHPGEWGQGQRVTKHLP